MTAFGRMQTYQNKIIIMDNEPLVVDYFSDILCVWAWIAERRIEELNRHFKSKIEIRYQYIDLFGDTVNRIKTQWIDKGMYEGFSKHVAEAAAPYESAPVNSKVWHITRPTTSANAHMVLKAIELTRNKQAAIEFADVLRKSFFIEANDISKIEILFRLLKQEGINTEKIKKTLNNGTALAALMSDYQKAHEYDIKGSPSFVMNNGRQSLFGNVGYRVLQANIEELLKSSSTQASWC
jgi:predicted DsbA family dithiol-disulfide isomerase